MSYLPRMIPSIFIALALVIAGAGNALAAEETIGAGYTAKPLAFPDGRGYDCDSWSGGTDGAGNFYIPCGGYIYRLAPDGTFLGAIVLADGEHASRDAAANVDGSIVYYTISEPRLDHPTVDDPHVGEVVKLVRRADGSYRRDTSFDVGPFDLGGSTWSGRNVEVDLAGRVYVTVNAYVYIFSANGTRIAAFGGDDRYEGAEYQEGLEIAQGIAVTPDGQHVYVVEQKFNHVQRWDRQANGDWIRSAWHLGHLGPTGDCVATDGFQSPYDVAIDGSGNVYVLDVTCRRIMKYTASTRAWRTTIWSRPEDADYLYHGIAVNWRGDMVVAGQGRIYRKDAGGGALSTPCAPDSDAPIVARLRAPRTVHSTTLRMSLRASDRCSRVTRIRYSGDVGPRGATWRKYTTNPTVALRPGNGIKTVYVTVSDAFGRTTTRGVRVRLTKAVPTPRRRISMSGIASICRPNPMANISSNGWRLADSCATFTGKVISLSRAGSTRNMKIRVPLSVARKMYRNVDGPMTFWVVGDSRTTMSRGIRVGARVQVTSALIVDTRTASLAAAPSWRWLRR